MVLNKSKRVIALGFFDGVHRGHGALLERVVEKSRELGAVASAFTFDRSPTAAITGQVVPLLSSVEDRAWLMRTCYGIQEVIVSSFDGMMRMDWRDFITQYLVKELGVVHVVAGHDFHFGYMGKGNPQRLQETCAQLGISWGSAATSSARWSWRTSPSPPPISAPSSPRGRWTGR